MNDAWITLTQNESDKVWDSFYEKFKFNPSIYSEDFPSILEPSPSITYKISKDFGNENKRNAEFRRRTYWQNYAHLIDFRNFSKSFL